MNLQTRIFHIALDSDVEAYLQTGEYRCASVDTEGFIHCCHKDQLEGVVNRYYQGVNEVQLLIIDPEQLTSPLILENTVGASELFPHVYGAIDAEAIVSIEPFSELSAERQALGQ